MKKMNYLILMSTLALSSCIEKEARKGSLNTSTKTNVEVEENLSYSLSDDVNN